MKTVLRRVFDGYLGLVQRAALPRLVDVDREERRLNLLRIYVGLVALVRTGLIVYAARHDFVDAATGALPARFAVWSAVELTLLGLFTLGICTPLATLGLIATYLGVFDPLMHTFTLGTLVLQHVWICFLFAGVGARFSVDGCLRGRPGLPGRALRRIYGWIGFPAAETLTVLYSLVFVSFALLNFAAVLLHLADPHWLGGYTVGVLLQDAYFNAHFAFFRSVAAAAPGLWRALSITGVVFQTVFQLLMIPLMFHRIGRRFVVWWGLVFIVVSLVFLRLSYLPFVELAIWAMLFLPRAPARIGEAARAGELAPAPPSALQTGYVAWWLLVCALFLVHARLPALGRLSERLGLSHLPLAAFLRSHGMEAPNVFNRVDLSMSEHWPMIYRQSPSGEYELVPFNGPDGERLAYHRHDNIYFGNSLRWRRNMIGRDLRAEHHRGELGYELVARILRFDHRLMGFEGPVRYRVDIMKTRSTHVELPPQERFRPRRVYSYEVLVR